jgi:hypothetical protein
MFQKLRLFLNLWVTKIQQFFIKPIKSDVESSIEIFQNVVLVNKNSIIYITISNPLTSPFLYSSIFCCKNINNIFLQLETDLLELNTDYIITSTLYYKTTDFNPKLYKQTFNYNNTITLQTISNWKKALNSFLIQKEEEYNSYFILLSLDIKLIKQK